MSFGKNMKRIRETLGLTQQELADRTGLQPAAISHFESGSREPSLKNIERICKGLGCSANVLINTKD